MLNLKEGFRPPPQGLFKTFTLDVDYFKGYWKSCSIFAKNLVNIDVLCDNFDYWFDVIKDLRLAQTVGLELEWMEGGTEVYPHTDTDLLGDPTSIRIWYPLQEDYFEFEGTFLEEGKIVKKRIKTNQPVIFSPHEEHSFKSEKDGYYFVIDMVKDLKNLTPDFWKHYLGFYVKHYIAYEKSLDCV